MKLLRELWNDDAGVLLSAEAAVVGTVAVVGVTAGLSTVSRSVNEELKDVAYAIRSLDQSYEIPAQKSCGAYTAGSSFKQEPVRQSVNKLKRFAAQEEKKQREQAERLQRELEKQEKQAARQSEDGKKRQPQKNRNRKSESNKSSSDSPRAI
jgi:septal ring factor EnvC (AmiA/AmiB activator)